jgi:hypothetical protein
LTSPNGATLGAVSTAVLTVNDDDGGSGPPSEPPPGPPGDPGTGTGQLGGGGPMDPAMLLLLLVGAARLGWSTSVTSSRSAPRFAGLGGDPTRRRPRLSRVDRRCRAATSSGACRDGA